MAFVVRTSTGTYAGPYPTKNQDNPTTWTEKQAKAAAAQMDKDAKLLGLSIRYEVKEEQWNEPQTYIVTAVKYKGAKDNPHGGQLHKFYVSLSDEAGEPVAREVYWQRKSDHLEVGERVYGHIEEGEYGPRFKTDQRPGGAGNFKAPQYEQMHEAQPLPADPQVERSRRIERQHSQEMAIRWADLVMREADEDETMALDALRTIIDWFVQDLDADVGDGDRRIAREGGPVRSADPDVSAEASPAQKGKLTKMFHEAGLSRDAMKAVVLYRCRSEKATKDGATQLITDLQEGATHDQLLAEIWDAHRSGNDPVATRAVKLIPSDTPWEDDGSLPPVEAKDESEVPF